MSDKKMGPVEESIVRLRERRYMERGAGAKKQPAKLATVDELRAKVSKVPTKISKRKKKRTKRLTVFRKSSRATTAATSSCRERFSSQLPWRSG
jgi:hypothetical protein